MPNDGSVPAAQPASASLQSSADAALQATIDALAKRNPPPSTEELYDAMMAHIEPDLLLKNRDAIKQPRPGETPEQTKERNKGYAAAFARYDKALDAYTAAVQGYARSIQRDAMTSIEQAERDEEAGGLANLEQSLAAA